ncbi:MAG: oligosaccharide flippase family protein [Magnetococcales bacterium]|nr:oligosaccharide flippase family protein [Magnetococcales bacterium]NGZ25580.1 oligosaccharide flippase family protein [Magnetococcales bacterium]
MSRLFQLGKDSVIYGIGGILSKGISVLVLPLYTMLFTPVEYGTIEMLTVIATFLSTIFAMGMDSVQSFYFFQESGNGKAGQARLVSAVLQWRVLWGGSLVLLCTLTSPYLNSWLFGGELSWHYFAVAFAGALLAQVMGQGIELFRLLYRPWPYILLSAAQAILATAITLLLVYVLNMGIFGYIIGSTLASLVIALLTLYMIREYLIFNEWITGWWPRLIRFGLPLLPAGLAFSIMSNIDRWFIHYFHGDTVLGYYAVGAKIAILIAFVSETFRKAWWPIAMDAMHGSDGPETFRMIARLYMGLCVAGLVILTFISPWLIIQLAGPEYYQAWQLVGVLAWQSVFYGFYLVASAGIWKAEKTHLAMYLMTGTALLNSLLNYLLVPAYAGMGAALATAISYGVWVTVTLVVSEKLWYVNFPIAVLFAQVVSGVLFLIWYLLYWDSTSLLLQTGIVTVLSTALMIGALDRRNRLAIMARIFQLWTPAAIPPAGANDVLLSLASIETQPKKSTMTEQSIANQESSMTPKNGSLQ